METYIIVYQMKKMSEPQYVSKAGFSGETELTIECTADRNKAMCFDDAKTAMDIVIYMGAGAKLEKVEFEYKHQ